MRVLVIGLKREFPLSPADALDIADRLVARAASAHTDGKYEQTHNYEGGCVHNHNNSLSNSF